MRRLFPLLTASLALPGCDAGRAAPATAARFVELESPAGEGSGEPFLSTSKGVAYLSWLEAAPEGGHDLWVSRLGAEGWGERRHVAYGDRFFVNWADFPSVVADGAGRLWSHWLERGAGGGYDYGIRVAFSDDGGASWSEPWTPHEDGTPTEHGFVSLFPMAGDGATGSGDGASDSAGGAARPSAGRGLGLVWLDGRRYASGPDGGAPTHEMTLRFRSLGPGGQGSETLLDARTCDCCQTDAALAASGPVVVYRDRSPDEVRDVYVTRWTGGGWTEGAPVHRDGWTIAACPVNGPAVAARGDTVAVAWFTAADDVPRVRVARSVDGGASFAAPVVVDAASPAGRVDLLLTAGGDALVSWLERTGGEAAEIRVQAVAASGRAGRPVALAATSAERASGFPRMAALPDGDVIVAWTDAAAGESARVRVARFRPPAAGGGAS